MNNSEEPTWNTKRQRLIQFLKEQISEISLETIMVSLEYMDKKSLIHDINSIAKTLKNEGKQVLVKPSVCVACGYIFKLKMNILKVPSKCPKCHKERIKWPLIKITEG